MEFRERMYVDSADTGNINKSVSENIALLYAKSGGIYN
jgi:hypothetical protein